MKVKLGWVVGVNVAAACLLMQGCKANRVRGNDYGTEVKTIESQQPVAAPADDIKVADTPAPAVQPAPAVVPEATAPAPAAEPEFTWYVVKPGDMLSKISKRYNIRQKAILDLNPGLSPNKLFAGKKIKLPGNVATGEATPVAAAPAAAAPAAAADAASVKAPKSTKAVKYTGATKTYVVKNGDSLGKIAHDNGTNVRTLKELNGLKKDRVLAGQKLKVPAEKAVAAPVEKTVAAPAKKDDAKAAAPKPMQKKEVAKKCTCAPGTVHDKPCACGAPDCKCKVAEKKSAAPAADAAAPAKPAPEAESAGSQPATPAPAADASAQAQQPATLETHTVMEGEDVLSIAISYGVSPSALMDANDLKSSEVKPGDVLKIPAKNAQ